MVLLMILTGEKDYYLIHKPGPMKKINSLTRITVLLIVLATACTGNAVKKNAVSGEANPSDTSALMLIGKDMITDIILKPDTTGDPWEVEKVKGFTGERMFRTLFDRVDKGEVVVYDCREEKTLNKDEVKSLEKEFSSDISRIGKVQFTEDWYFDTNRNIIVKKVKSVSFGFEMDKVDNMPPRYKALFRLKV